MAFEVERMIDANLNRLTEGLRVIEDSLRFNPTLSSESEKLKKLRHSIITVIQELSISLPEFRFSEKDQGRKVIGKNEFKRSHLNDILKANFKRVQEASRVIEEVVKTISPDCAQFFETLRYQLYDLEHQYIILKEFPKNPLYTLVTQSLCKHSPSDVIKWTCDAGTDIIQLREKDMEDKVFLEWTLEVLELTSDYPVSCMINDRIHIAQLTSVAGVHLGQGDLPITEARKLLQPHQWIGRSTSALPVAQKAEEEGHTYIGVGPLFETNTKKHRTAVGTKYIQEVNDHCRIPYVAIGSINRDTLPEVLKAKPKGIAICTGIISTDKPYDETLFFKEQFQASLL